MNNAALSYRKIGNHHRALELQQQVMKMYNHGGWLPENHPTAANGKLNLASTYTILGEFDKALPLQLEALKIYEASRTKEHRDVADCLANTATTYSRLRRFDKAAELSKRAFDIHRRVLPAGHPDIMKSRKKMESMRSMQMLNLIQCAMGVKYRETDRLRE